MSVFLEWLIFQVICTLRSSKRWWRSWKSEAHWAVFPSNLTNFSNDKRITNHCRTSASKSYRTPETATKRPTERQTDRHQLTGRQTDRQTDWDTDRHTHTGRQTGRQTDRQTGRDTETVLCTVPTCSLITCWRLFACNVPLVSCWVSLLAVSVMSVASLCNFWRYSE